MLLCVIGVAIACVPEDDNRINFHVEFIPVQSVELPEFMAPGYTYPIKVKFVRPSDCHYFDGFFYQPNGPVRVVAVQTIYIEDASCAPLATDAPEEQSFNVQCPSNYQYDYYLFKFYIGEDQQGNQLFLEQQVPVAN